MAIVYDAGLWRRAAELPEQSGAAFHRRRRCSGHNQARGLYIRVGSKVKTGTIHEHNDPVGFQIAVDLRGGLLVDPVPDDGSGGGLNESRQLSGTDVERLPGQKRV